LRAPANDFVKGFVGAERGLKRLALITIADIDLEEGPVVRRDESVLVARDAMEKFDFAWTSVVDEEGRLLGWVDGSILDGHEAVAEVDPKRFSAFLRSNSSLREALDSIVTSRTHVAVVVSDDGKYEGILTLERISREIVS
jgi:osmoprotectant transport system ATP-binding protein